MHPMVNAVFFGVGGGGGGGGGVEMCSLERTTLHVDSTREKGEEKEEKKRSRRIRIINKTVTSPAN